MRKALQDKLRWLDPFTYVDEFVMPHVNPSGDKAIETIVYLFFAFLFAYVLYNFVLAFLLGSPTPLVIVYSGSMEPVLYRGDVVILTKASGLDVDEVQVDFAVGGRNLFEFADISYERTPSGSLLAKTLKIQGAQYPFDKSGPIVVYYSSLRRQDIIHRAVLKLKATDGDYLVTFGDNNPTIDQAEHAMREPACGAGRKPQGQVLVPSAAYRVYQAADI